MTPLAGADILTILITCIACTAVVAGLAMLLLRLLRRRYLFVQLLVVAISAILAVMASVLAISIEMYLSVHDLTVLTWVVLTAGVSAAVAAGVVGRSVRSSVEILSAALHQIGTGNRVRHAQDAVGEFWELSRELVAVSEKVRAAREELEELDSARRRFFAWISHDLRTPLAALRVIAESAEGSVAPEARELARSVGAQAVNMTHLVDDLFELSQLSSGQLRLRSEQVDLLDLVSDSVADMRIAAAQHQVGVVAKGVKGQVIWADPHRLGRIVSNLLSNAIRHAPAGTEILITVTQASEQRVTLGVFDHGAGVSVTDLDRMFEVGWRDDNARTPDARDAVSSGAGLGLAIARGFARAHGGDITAEHVNDGFRMNVVLPCNRVEEVTHRQPEDTGPDHYRTVRKVP